MMLPWLASWLSWLRRMHSTGLGLAIASARARARARFRATVRVRVRFGVRVRPPRRTLIRRCAAVKEDSTDIG